MPNAHILIAEDDENIRVGLSDALASEGHRVEAVEDGARALEVFSRGDSFDLLVLDLMMPEVSGYDVCREVRKQDVGVPILMLTAKGEEIDKVVGFELGADDYVTKPFGIRELLARVSALLRRGKLTARANQDKGAGEIPAVFEVGGAKVDRKQYQVTTNGKALPLTARELKLLELFYTHPAEVLTRDYLLDQAWGIEYYGTTRTLDQHIAQLRKKVETGPAPEVILTVHGVGYKYAG